MRRSHEDNRITGTHTTHHGRAGGVLCGACSASWGAPLLASGRLALINALKFLAQLLLGVRGLDSLERPAQGGLRLLDLAEFHVGVGQAGGESSQRRVVKDLALRGGSGGPLEVACR